MESEKSRPYFPKFLSSILTIFVNFPDFLTFSCYKETKDVSIKQMMSAFFYFQPIPTPPPLPVTLTRKNYLQKVQPYRECTECFRYEKTCSRETTRGFLKTE